MKKLQKSFLSVKLLFMIRISMYSTRPFMRFHRSTNVFFFSVLKVKRHVCTNPVGCVQNSKSMKESNFDELTSDIYVCRAKLYLIVM